MLYFVATPIGNLKDISYRAVEVLNSVDIIACEDTRNSMKLLLNYDIRKKLIAYHKFNEKNSSDGIINLLKEGKNIAVISDAGMPIISDPGSILINKLKENNLEYTIIPGANAGLCALLLSGLSAERFTFVGFLPEQNKQKRMVVENVESYTTTLIFYVSPYNVIKDIEFLGSVLGNRKACLVNEITKLHEKTISFNLQEELNIEPRGEYVLIVEGAEIKKQEFNNSPKERLDELIKQGINKNDAIKQVAKERKVPKNEIYKLTIN